MIGARCSDFCEKIQWQADLPGQRVTGCHEADISGRYATPLRGRAIGAVSAVFCLYEPVAALEWRALAAMVRR